MDRTACTEPQCLYKGALYFTVELYLYSLYGPYGLYRASVPVQGCTLPLPLPLPLPWPHARGNVITSDRLLSYVWKFEPQNVKHRYWFIVISTLLAVYCLVCRYEYQCALSADLFACWRTLYVTLVSRWGLSFPSDAVVKYSSLIALLTNIVH